MTTDRIYKGRKSVSIALEELQNLAGKQFHSKVVEAALIALKNIQIDTLYNQLPQVKEILISANNNLDVYQEYSECVLEDEFDDFRGPIAGICEGLKTTSTDFLLVVPCDGPRLPMDLARRMLASCLKEGSLLATVHDGQFKQPTYSLIHKSLLANAKDFLIRGERKLGQWLKENHSTLVDYSDQPEAFVNINSVEQLQELETRSLQQG